jgi:hypothetical protein
MPGSLIKIRDLQVAVGNIGIWRDSGKPKDIVVLKMTHSSRKR